MTDANLKAQLDERRIAKGLALGLPLVTATMAVAVGTIVGVPMAILVLAAGVLLGVIALFWASLRVLSGDAALPPEIEALDRTAHGVDALASRKKMLILALKDLERERDLGKLDDEDFEQVSSTYRAELRDILRRIDASLEPYRNRADEAARAHLARVGLAETGYRGEQQPVPVVPISEPAPSSDAAVDDVPSEKDVSPSSAKSAARVACTKCTASNEPDAKFCKSCGATLGAEARSE